MLKTYSLSENRIVETPEQSSSIFVFISPDANEMKKMDAEFNIDSHNIDSALDPDELGRVELEPDHVAIIVKRPKNYSSEDNFLFKVTSLGFFLFKEKLIIVKSDEAPLFEGKVFAGVSSLADVLLRINYAIVTHFLSHLKVINMISESLEQKINQAMENKYLLNMFTLEKSLVYYLNATNSNSMVIEKLKINANKLGFSLENVEFIDDLTIESNQCVKQAEIYSNVLAGLMDARASIISNNLNVMMKNLNAIVIAVAVPSFFAGLGGMSEFSAIVGGKHLLIAYPLFVAAMICIGLITFLIIKKGEKMWMDS